MGEQLPVGSIGEPEVRHELIEHLPVLYIESTASLSPVDADRGRGLPLDAAEYVPECSLTHEALRPHVLAIEARLGELLVGKSSPPALNRSVGTFRSGQEARREPRSRPKTAPDSGDEWTRKLSRANGLPGSSRFIAIAGSPRSRESASTKACQRSGSAAAR